MLLRASSRAAGAEIDLGSAMGDGRAAGVVEGRLLADFVEAVCLRRDDLDPLRSAVRDRLGPAGLVEAAATVAVFNGLVRVADGCGIPLDDGAIAESDDFRHRLGIDRYGGAANTDPGRADPTRLDGTVEALFR